MTLKDADKIKEAIQNSDDFVGGSDDIIKVIDSVQEVVISTDTDTISRKAAIDAVEFGITYAKAINKETGEVTVLFEESNAELQEAADRIKKLPPAQSKPAQWIQMLINQNMYRCSNCNVAWNKRLVFDLDHGKEVFMKYCPCCGKKMEKEVSYE